MARAKPSTSSWRVGKRSGLFKATFSITGEQLEALKREADRRRPAGALRSDTSAVLREVLDAWLARRR
jgi:hypothetical protein